MSQATRGAGLTGGGSRRYVSTHHLRGRGEFGRPCERVAAWGCVGTHTRPDRPLSAGGRGVVGRQDGGGTDGASSRATGPPTYWEGWSGGSKGTPLRRG